MGTAMDISSIDLEKNPKASIALSLAQTGYCSEHNMDAQDPVCAHMILTGKIVKLEKGSNEEAYAKEALFSRHPAVIYWPADHGFYFTKLDIENIVLLDFYGGASQVPVKDYFAATLNEFDQEDALQMWDCKPDFAVIATCVFCQQ